MNYASPYTPNYGAPAAYAQSPYDAAALEAYAQAQQHAAALDQLQQQYGADWNAQQQYPMALVGTGQLQGTAAPGGVVVAATPPNLMPWQGAWWQQPTFGVPRWALGAGALALTGIGLAWQAGMFGGKKGGGGGAPSSSRSRTTVRRSTSRDASRGARTTSISRTGPKGARTTLSTTTAPTGERDAGRAAGRRTRGKKRGRRHGKK